jgi:hypothetical protein
MNSNDEAAVRGTKSSSTGTSRTRMPYSKTLALILLVSSFWQMAHSAPTPQQKDGTVFKLQKTYRPSFTFQNVGRKSNIYCSTGRQPTK